MTKITRETLEETITEAKNSASLTNKPVAITHYTASDFLSVHLLESIGREVVSGRGIIPTVRYILVADPNREPVFTEYGKSFLFALDAHEEGTKKEVLA